ncbi:MAG: hypothetical protein MMC33_000177 [Icmadophila ericetorum]|nr:hypothetical protein [Icmadophila ericetorum]
MIAYAPWLSASCTKSYLASASLEGARAFIFFIPDSSTEPPPLVNSPKWALDDGGKWKSDNRYPVYAIPGFFGMEILKQLALYSGNMTDAPNGHLLTEQYDSRDYVRLYTIINPGSSSSLPGTWVFLLIVIGILLGVVLVISVSMHYVQRSRQRRLQRRISNGEVDLEALGITRIKVPQDVVARIPIYLYLANTQENSGGHLPSLQLSQLPGRCNSGTPFCEARSTTTLSSPLRTDEQGLLDTFAAASLSQRLSKPHKSSLSSYIMQRTCTICLEDFLDNESLVRKLPCGHIYHLHCIDTFLQTRSSLCPICKSRVLPVRYCPVKVTNGMVRKERLIRRMRERVTIESVDGNADGPMVTIPYAATRIDSLHQQLGRVNDPGRDVGTAASVA